MSTISAIKLLNEVKSFIAFANDGFKYNLQVLPDTLTSSILLFALLLQSAPLAILGACLIVLSFLQPVLAHFISDIFGNMIGVESSARCAGHFPGVSFERLVSIVQDNDFQRVNGSLWPSYYSLFLGFLSAYFASLPVIYHDEMEASPRRKAASILGLVVIGLTLLTCSAYRYISGCESFCTLFIGILAGVLFGMLAVAGISYFTDRRGTNILAFPLIADKTADGKPIYVCERPKKDNAST